MLLMVWTYIGQLVRFQQTTRLFLSNRRRNIISNISDIPFETHIESSEEPLKIK